MTPEEFFENIKKEKPENQSLFKYTVKHVRGEHSRSFLSEVANYVKWCKKKNKMPADNVIECLRPYFRFLREVTD